MAVRSAIAVLLVGLAVDVTAHVAADGAGPLALTGHLVTLAGMVLGLAGMLHVALAPRSSTGRRER